MQTSSEIIHTFYNEHKESISDEINVIIQKYRILYLLYIKGHQNICYLDEEIYKLSKHLNLFTRKKYQAKLIEVATLRSKLCTIILDLISIEHNQVIQDILNQYSNEDFLDIVLEIKKRCYIEGGSYLDRNNLFPDLE